MGITACSYIISEVSILYSVQCTVRLIADSVVFTLRGQPEDYGHALEVDDHKEVDIRR